MSTTKPAPLKAQDRVNAHAEAYKAVLSGQLSLGQAVAALRKLSGLNQHEFAKHRGISLAALRQIEQDVGNPTVSTLNKVVVIFGVKVGFVRAANTPPLHNAEVHSTRSRL